MVKVLSVGGSIIAPDAVDSAFIAEFGKEIRRYLDENLERRLIMVVGGGGPARSYQNACREVLPSVGHEALDWIGIMATRLNAQLLKSVFADLCPMEVVTDPTVAELFTGRVMVAAGWKPGFSTDYDAVLLAERYGADTVVNLSNIAKVYTADPKLDPKATPIDDISWKDFKAIVGEEWTPGKNLPFDPIATKRAAELGLTVVCAAGKDLPNLRSILHGLPFNGTTIRA